MVLIVLILLIVVKMLTIVIADSRGRHLDMYVDHDDIKISFQSGARLMTVAHKALEIINRFHPDIILLMAGVNDMTVRNKYTGRVSLISTSPTTIVNHVLQQINLAKSLILGSFPDVKVIIGGIIGLSIHTYNRRPNTSPLQSVVDDAVTALNAQIRQINEDSGVPHPRLTSKVHTWKKGVKKNLYYRLRDGLHPGDLLLHSWALQIRKMHDKCVELFSTQ